MQIASDYRVVFVTAPSLELAQSLATTLVAEKLCACCTLLPQAISVYSWQGAIEQANETQMLIKTSSAQLEQLEQRLIELHPYEVPEIIAVQLDSVSPKYIQWLQSSLS